MKQINRFAEILKQWKHVAQEYGAKYNYPFRAILKNCSQKMGVEIIDIQLIYLGGESAVKLSLVNRDELIITEQNCWQFIHGQTKNKTTIFTTDIN